MARKENFLSCEENGKDGAERIANMYRAQGCKVTVEHGQIPQWGSAIPTSSTYGKTELGYRITVVYPSKDDNKKNGNKFGNW